MINQETVQNIILETFTEMGVYIDSLPVKSNENAISQSDDIDLRDYVVDSLMFISFIIELESKLQVEIPAELLFIDSLSSLSGFSYLLMNTINNGKEDPDEKTIEEARA